MGAARWTSTTTYAGNQVTSIPPTGGTPTRTTPDAAANTVSLTQFLTASLNGASQSTAYTYDRLGRLTALLLAALERAFLGGGARDEIPHPVPALLVAQAVATFGACCSPGPAS